MIRDRWEAFKNGLDSPAMIERRIALGAAACLVAATLPWTAAAPAPADTAARPSEADLQAITDTGRRIAAYHEAVGRTRAALAGEHADVKEARAVVADRNGVTHVYFFKKDESGPQARGWVLIADAIYQPRAGEVGATVFPDRAKAPPADAVTHLRALEAGRAGATARPGGPTGPWDEAVFKEKAGAAYVVYLQSQSAPGSARFGADVRLRISGDGMQVGEMTPLHGETSTVPVPARPGASPTLHSHTQGDLPTETDVAVVLEHPTIAPHLLLTPHHMFRIEADGRLSYLGPNAVPPAAPGGGR